MPLYNPSELTDWATCTWVTTWVTNVTNTGQFREVGNQVQFWIQISLSGAPTAADLTLALPAEWPAVDETAMAASFFPCATGYYYDLNTTTFWTIQGTYNLTSNLIEVRFTTGTGDAVVDEAAPFTGATGDLLSLTGSLPT